MEKTILEKPITMRNHWFSHVAKTRKKLTRERKEPVSHREAMRMASTSWAPVKEKTSTNRVAFSAHRGCCLEADSTLPIDRG